MFEAGAGPGSAGVLESASAGVASGGTAAFVVTLALRDVLVFEEEVEDVVDSVAGAPSEVAVVLEVALLLAAAVAFALEVEVEVVEAVESATDPLSGADAFFGPADFFAQVVFLVAVVFSVAAGAFLEALLEAVVFADALGARSFDVPCLRETDFFGVIANGVR